MDMINKLNLDESQGVSKKIQKQFMQKDKRC